MVKLLKRNKAANAGNKNGKKPEQGISASGDVLRDSLTLGLAITLIPIVIAAAYLYTIRAPAQKNELVNLAAKNYAAQQAKVVQHAVFGLRERLQSAAQSPTAMNGILESSSSQGLRRIEEGMMAFFPDAMSLRVFPLDELGTTGLDSRNGELRNNIEVDLVRRASNGEEVKPEAYQYEGAWIASIAAMAAHPNLPDRRAVVMASISGESLGALLDQRGEVVGRFTLEQRVYGRTTNRDLAIVSRGEASGSVRQIVDIEGTSWRVIFEPGDELIDTLSSNVRPDYDILLLILGCLIAGFAFTAVRSVRSLKAEIRRITEAAEHRTAMEVHIPQLVPLARNLRKLSMRKARADRAPITVAAPKVVSDEASSSPLTGIEGPATQGLRSTIFRAYDIRGDAESELDDETVFRIASAIGTLAGEMGEQSLIVGCDGRVSSGRIKAIVERALLQSGRDVIDVGLVPTPLVYFATSTLDSSSGIMITGSHNPADYNGMKVVLKGQTVASGTIEKIRAVAQNGRFSKGTGHAGQRDIISEYLDEVIGDIAIAMPLKVVVDGFNGATGHIAPALLEEIGLEVIAINCEVDGSFPNHAPDTSDERNLAHLSREVVAKGADFGVAYDGDGDRVAVVTSSGRIIRTDVLMMILAQDVVSRNPGADVVFDVKCSRNLSQVITQLGGRPVLWKTGHALMKEKMRETAALLGGEFSGHIFYGERWYGFDDGMYTTCRLAEILSSSEATLDELLSDLPIGISTPEILVPVSDEDKFALMQSFLTHATFPDGKSNELDGLRVDFEDGWGLLRASNTGPALTARFEASSNDALARIQSLFREQLLAVQPDLDVPF
ncbi:MAG: phosphomannomutase/phosphoglucomutase [Pseudomonadota bacterium]